MKATGDIAVYRSLRHGNQPTVSFNSLYRGYPFRYLESIGSEYGENIPMRNLRLLRCVHWSGVWELKILPTPWSKPSD